VTTPLSGHSLILGSDMAFSGHPLLKGRGPLSEPTSGTSTAPSRLPAAWRSWTEVS
jgi:hypothetical protein